MDMITSIQSSTSGWLNQGGPSVDMITLCYSDTELMMGLRNMRKCSVN